MCLTEKILALIGERKPINAGVTLRSDFYRDLGFDSLAFIRLLVELEESFGVEIEIWEIESCLQVGALISLVQRKSEAKKP